MKKRNALRFALAMLFILVITLLASCSKSYVISFDSDGGSTHESIVWKDGDTITPPVPTKEGYTFVGWYLNNDEWKFEHYAITKDITLKAKWIKNHNVSFDSNGGTHVEQTYVPDGMKLKAPSAPIKEDAEFIGWYCGETKWNFDTDTVSGDITLVARWKEIHKVIFNADGGTLVPTQAVKNGETASLPIETAKLGYKFDGWYKDGVKWDFSTPVTSDITLIAKWIPYYTVSFSTEGAGKIDSQSVLAGTHAAKPQDITKQGYVFLGWYAGDKLWSFDTDVVSSNITLTARWTPFTYKVSFNSDGGTPVADMNKIPGEKITAPAIPEKAGYTFLGWYVGEALWNFDTDTVTSNLTLTAKWRKHYTVTYTSVGETYLTLKVFEGEKLTPPTEPSMEGFRFLGWYFGETKWNFDTDTVNEDITFIANWCTLYTVSFELNGGEGSYPSVTVLAGIKIDVPALPEKPGYAFLGWYAGQTLWNFDTVISSNLTLSAKWTKLHRVSFDTQGGTEIADAVLTDGSLIPIPTPPVKELYKFAGWYCNNEPWSFDTAVTSDITLTAKWDINYYVISFNTDGAGLIEPIKIERGAKIPKPENPSKDGVAFAGWYFGGGEWNFDDVPTSNMQLVAYWDTEFFEVSYDSNGANETYPPERVPINGYATLKQPTKDGYMLVGWFTDDGTKWSFTTMQVTETMTLTARWIKEHTVSFDSDGGSAIADQKVPDGATAYEEIPTKQGYRFLGWYVGETEWDFLSPVSSDMTLTAKWKRTYTVSFDLAGGSIDGSSSLKDAIVDEGEKPARPTDPVQNKHKFLGWYLGETPWNFETDVPDGDITLTAKWVKVYYVTFDTAGGDGSYARQDIVAGTLATKPTQDPTKTHYSFNGWLLNGAAFDFSTPITEDTVLVASYTPVKYTVSFDTDGGSAVTTPISVDAFSLISAPATSKTGYYVKEWVLPNGTAWDFSTDTVTDNISLKAVWTSETYTVSFELNGGTSSAGTAFIDSQTVNYNSLLTKPADPKQEGFKFMGWYNEDKLWNFATDKVTEAITLTAKWTELISVSFDTAGGEGTYPTTFVEKGALLTKPANPTMEGHLFLGWYLGDEPWSFAATTVTTDITLTAKWEKCVYLITFDTNDDSGTAIVPPNQDVEYGGKITKPADPYISDLMVFKGWLYNGELWDFENGIVRDNMVLVATYEVYGSGSEGGIQGPWDEGDNVLGPFDGFNKTEE